MILFVVSFAAKEWIIRHPTMLFSELAAVGTGMVWLGQDKFHEPIAYTTLIPIYNGNVEVPIRP